MIARGSSNSRIYSLVMPLRNRETAANYLSSVDSLKTLINENENVIDELFFVGKVDRVHQTNRTKSTVGFVKRRIVIFPCKKDRYKKQRKINLILYKSIDLRVT